MGHVSRRFGGWTRTSTAAAWPGRSSALASVTTCGATSGSASRVVVDDVDAAQERLHRQARRVAGAAAGGQHVVRAGGVVAERDRRVRADEDRAGVAHAHRDLAGVARLDLQVLGGVGVDDREPGSMSSTSTMPHCGPASASAMRSECLVAGTCTASSASTASASSTLVVTSTLAAIDVVLGLADQVGGDERGVGGVVGEDRDLGGAGLGVDADAALEQPLGRGDVDVARAGDQVTARRTSSVP